MGRCDVREGGGVKRESYGREKRKDGGKREGNISVGAVQGCSAGEGESWKSDGQGKLQTHPFAGGGLVELAADIVAKDVNKKEKILAELMILHIQTVAEQGHAHKHVNMDICSSIFIYQ